MARRPRAHVRAPTSASLPNTLRIPSTSPSLVKTLARLSRASLLDLVLEWLEDGNVSSFPPFLDRQKAARLLYDSIEFDVNDGISSPYPAAGSVEEARSVYTNLQERKGAKREVIDRILEGDWRHGITLRQLAMVDMRYMDEHPSRLRWTAMELTRLDNNNDNIDDPVSGHLPRISASTFLANLQREISPLIKSHYHMTRSSSLPLLFVRIFMTDSPYQYPRQSSELSTDSSKIIYLAFPDSSPFVYTSLASSFPFSSPSFSRSTTAAAVVDTRNLRRIVAEAIPKALSRPHQRYSLRPTALSAKNLSALLALRGPGRSNNANGAFSIFADAVVEGSPLDPRPADSVSPEEYLGDDEREKLDEDVNDTEWPTMPSSSKKRKRAIHSRFGTVGTLSSAPLDRLDVKLLDPPPPSSSSSSTTAAAAAPFNNIDPSRPVLSLTFSGSDVISGIRKLAELGVVDPERMPSWMTGEEAVSVASVRRGKRIVEDDQ